VERVGSLLDTIAQAFDRALALSDDGRTRLEGPSVLQSWPGIVHGGCLVALVDAAAGAQAEARARVGSKDGLTSSVPIETALDLETVRSDDIISLSIRHEGQT
jgi:hypothetical protein